MNPQEVAEIAKEMNVKIHAIGIGSTGRVFVPSLGYVQLEYDPQTLQEIADITGGKFFHAKNTKALKLVYDEIDKLELRKEKVFEFVSYEEQFLKPLFIGFILLIIYELLRATIFLRVP